MADKNIGSLTQATQLDDESLLLIEQQGEARKIYGAWFKEYVIENAKKYAISEVDVTEIDGGYRLTITGANGTFSVDILGEATILSASDDGEGNVILSGAGI